MGLGFGVQMFYGRTPKVVHLENVQSTWLHVTPFFAFRLGTIANKMESPTVAPTWTPNLGFRVQWSKAPSQIVKKAIILDNSGDQVYEAMLSTGLPKETRSLYL